MLLLNRTKDRTSSRLRQQGHITYLLILLMRLSLLAPFILVDRSISLLQLRHDNDFIRVQRLAEPPTLPKTALLEVPGRSPDMFDWLRLVFEDWTGVAPDTETGNEWWRVRRRGGCVEALTVRDVVDADCGGE